MPNTIPLTQPQTIQTGLADVLLTQADFLRNNTHILNQFFNTYGGYTTFATKMRAFGWAKGRMDLAVQSPITEHYFQGREKRSFTVGAITTASTGVAGQIVIALSAADMRTIVGDDGVTRNFSRPRKGETIQFGDKNNYKIIAKNQTVNPHQLTIKPKNSAINPGTAIIVNAKAMILAPTSAEGAGQPKSVENTYAKYQNRFAIVKEEALTSGTAKTTKSPLRAISGQQNYWYIKDVEEATVRHEINKSKILLHDELGNNIQEYVPDFDDNFPDRGTEGFIKYATTTGQINEFTDLDSYDLDEFDEVAAYYRSLMISTNTAVVWQGNDIGARTENVLIDYLAGNSFTDYISKTFMKDALKSFQDDDDNNFSADDMFVSLGFNGVRKNKFNFLFSILNELNDSEGGGIFDYPSWQFFMPFGTMKDAKSKASVPYLGYEYRGQEGNGYSREDILYRHGGAAITNRDQFDVERTSFVSEIALHAANGELIVVNRPVAA